MAKKRLTLRDKQGNAIDYDISAARVTIDAEGKTLEVKLSELVAAIASTTMRVVFNGNTHNVNGGTINLGNQLQPDWAETSTTYPSYIKNKPDVVTGIKVGASGSTITPTNGVVTIPESGGGSVDVDNAMSASSDNPVANRVIKAYVDNLINGIINGAPAALDTLNELSAALGNDSNFAATITQQLALKANDASVVKSISVNGQSPQTPNNGNVNLVIEAGAQGQKGNKGDTVVIGDEEEFLIVNDLVSGGEADALSAEMGRRLAMLSGTFAEAWAHAQAIPYVFPWLWVETVGGDAICKPIWHRGSGNFVDAAGASVSVETSAAPSAPTFSETSGSTVGKGTQVTITPAAGSALYYKIDNGSWIVRDMAVTIEVNATCVITAKCVNNYGPSSEATCSLTVSGPAVPSFAAAQGTTIGTGNVVSRGGSIVVSVPQGGELHYSTDGVNYTTASGLSVTIPVPAAGVHIYAYNVEDGDQSSTIDNAYTMAALAAPSFSPAAGTLPMGGGTVEITHTDNNVDIFYTTDGSTPTDQSTQYDPLQPISVTADMTIKAIAKDNYGTSEVATAAYEVPVDHKFQFKIALTGDNSTEYVPITPINDPSYNFIAYWGEYDEHGNEKTTVYNTGGSNKGCGHTYTGSEGDEFTITLRLAATNGALGALRFFDSSCCNPSALVAIIDNSLECDTDFSSSGLYTAAFIGCSNLESICANALQNNTNTKVSFGRTKITEFPDGLFSHLTKSGVQLTSLPSMFHQLDATITESQMTELISVVGGVTFIHEMFCQFQKTSVPKLADLFSALPNGAVTGVGSLFQNTKIVADAKDLYDILVNKVASGATTLNCFNSNTLTNRDQVPSAWGGKAT